MQRFSGFSDATHAMRFAVEYEYRVDFTHQVFNVENPVFLQAIRRLEPQRRHRMLVVIDQGVYDAWPNLIADIRRYVETHTDSLALAGEPVIVAGGESVKNDHEAPTRLHRVIHERGIDRQSFCVIIGGGAVLDMAGFAAAVAHRGVRVVRLPTTVLGQNDSGVGVKTSLNAFKNKNFIGSFAPPFAVINDFRFLETLSRRDRIAGIAEAVKVALIRDADFFEWLVDNAQALAALEPDATWEMIRRCAELHMQHIATCGDPFGFGSARPLDFGHWAAHKLEGLSDHELRHGEAVAIGLALDSYYSHAAGLLSREDLERIRQLLETLGFRLYSPLLQRAAQGGLSILAGLAEFREHLGGDLTVTLIRAPGSAVEVHEMDTERISRAIDWLKSFADQPEP